MRAIELLKKYNACSEAREWVGDMTISQAWLTCPRGDWALWMYARLYPSNIRELTLSKGHCANTARHLMSDQRSLDAVDAAIAFGEGRISREELDLAAAAAYAYADYAAAYAADYADYAADYAAAYAADVADAYAADAAAAAYAAAVAYAAAEAYAAAADAARQKNQQETADICRKYLTLDL